MVSLFKSKLLVVAIVVVTTVAFTKSAAAGTITSTGQVFALEGSIVAKRLQVGVDIHIALDLGTDYIASDVVTLTIKGAKFITTDLAWQPTLTFGDGAGTPGSATGKANFMDVVNGNTLRFRMASNAGLLENVTLTGVVLNSTDLIHDTEITVSATAISMSNFIGYYDTTPEAVVAEVVKQFNIATVKALDATIDAGNGRKVFLRKPAPDFTSQDRLAFRIIDHGGIHGFVANQAVYTIAGKDLGFLRACDEAGNNNGILENTELQKCVVPTVNNDSITMSVNDKLTELTVVQTANSPDGLDTNISLAFQAPGIASAYRIVPQEFTVSAKVANGPVLVSQAAKNNAAGQWLFNGSIVHVAYMPYSATIDQTINITNRSLQQGDVSVIAIDETGIEYDLGIVATAKPQRITRIADEVKAALAAKGVLVNSSTKRIALEIVTDILNREVEVFTAYNVDNTGDRLVVNSSNGK